MNQDIQDLKDADESSCLSDFIESEHNNLSMQHHHEMVINESMINRGAVENKASPQKKPVGEKNVQPDLSDEDMCSAR
jgi:hypothetical protein